MVHHLLSSKKHSQALKKKMTSELFIRLMCPSSEAPVFFCGYLAGFVGKTLPQPLGCCPLPSFQKSPSRLKPSPPLSSFHFGGKTPLFLVQHPNVFLGISKGRNILRTTFYQPFFGLRRPSAMSDTDRASIKCFKAVGASQQNGGIKQTSRG